MSIAELQNRNVTFTREAIDSFDSYSDKLDDLVYNVAKLSALARAGVDGEVEVTLEDIQKSWMTIVKMLDSEKLPEPVREVVDGLRKRFEEVLDERSGKA